VDLALRSPAKRGIFAAKKIASSPEAPRNDSIDLFLIEAGRPRSQGNNPIRNIGCGAASEPHLSRKSLERCGSPEAHSILLMRLGDRGPNNKYVNVSMPSTTKEFATGLLHFQKALWGATSSPSSSGKGPATRMGFCPALNTERHGRLIVGLSLLAPVSSFNVVSSTP
jgi:hypothetical protein